MSFEQVLNRIYSFIRPKPATVDTQRPERLRRLLQLASFEQTYPVIHVAGTKGKGSVCAMCAAALQANDLRVGLYTSPHLVNLRERFQINGEWISEADLQSLMDELEPLMRQVDGLGFPEVTTALALTWFRQQRVDIAVFESHIGGLYDPTNVVTPAVSVITSLGYDHTDLLGKTLAEIATHKAGIIKPGRPVVSAPQPPEAAAVIRHTAAAQNAPLTLLGEDRRFEILKPMLEGQAIWDWRAQVWRTNLLGEHQGINLAVALAALAHVDLPMTPAATQRGLMAVRWPGRLEIIAENPTVLLDGAHTAESALALRQTIVQLFPQSPRVFVYASKASKDVRRVLAELLPIADHLILTQVELTDQPEKLHDAALALGFTNLVEIVPDSTQAVQRAIQIAGRDGMVCITGSLYLVGGVQISH